MLSNSAYLRFHENQWSSSISTFVTPEILDLCIDPLHRPGAEPDTRIVCAIDCGPKWDCSALVALAKDEKLKRGLRLIDHRVFEPRGVTIDFEKTIEKTIYPVGFYKNKAVNIQKICDLLLSQYKGQVPDNIYELLKLPGVGRKTANLVVTLGYNKPGICVDTHVHRIANRWGYVKTKTPEQTEMALRQKLPAEYWIIINDLLVSYGQNLCKPVSPLCSTCRIRSCCDRKDVKVSR